MLWFIIVFLVCLTLGVLFGMLLRRTVWFAVGLVGIIGGFFLGAFIYTVILQTSGWESYWGFWGISIGVAVLGGVLSFAKGQTIVLLSTSFFGSYMFVSGLNYIFGGSVGLAEMCTKISNGEAVVFSSASYVYLCILICLFAFTTVWQAYKEEEHEELVNHMKKDGKVE